MRNNDFADLKVDGLRHSISHLKNLRVKIDVIFDNGDTRTITVHMRPTNHLFTRSVTLADEQAKESLIAKGLWMTNYDHQDCDKQNNSKLKVKEHRIFCPEKLKGSLNFPEFVTLLAQNPKKITVLANPGDIKTCLSGTLKAVTPNACAFLVFFTLHKVNSKEANMIIETAFCVNSLEHGKARKLFHAKKSGEAKPFVMILKNVMEGRKPMENSKKRK